MIYEMGVVLCTRMAACRNGRPTESVPIVLRIEADSRVDAINRVQDALQWLIDNVGSGK